MSAFDPVTMDPPPDADYPAALLEAEIESHGAQLVGRVYVAAGAGPHPLAVMLHGFPGHEQNADLAQAIRRAGWNAAILHYRGAWGSGGAYRFQHVVEDAAAMVQAFRQPQMAGRTRTDAGRIVAVGHSLGGWAALMIAAQGVVDAAVSIAGVNMGLWSEMLNDMPEAIASTRQFFAGNLPPLQGVSADDLIDETLHAGPSADLLQHIERLKACHLLLIGGRNDASVPPALHHVPLVAALRRANAPHLTEALMQADHSFSGERIALARMIVGWLGQFSGAIQ